MSVNPEPFIDSFNNLYTQDKKPEKALWQSKRESNKSELIVRVLTAMVAISAIIAITLWWQKNKVTQPFSSQAAQTLQSSSVQEDINNLPQEASKTQEKQVPLTPISRMQSMFNSKAVKADTEKAGG